jgi:hypothetical protein
MIDVDSQPYLHHISQSKNYGEKNQGDSIIIINESKERGKDGGKTFDLLHSRGSMRLFSSLSQISMKFLFHWLFYKLETSQQ